MVDESPSTSRLVLIPALITLAVTLARLIGELNHWSPTIFNRTAGGGGSPLGISWLALLFAVYFAVRLQNLGRGPERAGAALGYTALALLICVGGLSLFFFGLHSRARSVLWAAMAVMVAGVYTMRRGWPSYWNVMLSYALWARIPVIVVMFFAIRGDWGTHYDVPPPNGGHWDTWVRKFVEIGLIPQLFFWVPYTVVICGLIGVAVAAARRRRTTVAAPA